MDDERLALKAWCAWNGYAEDHPAAQEQWARCTGHMPDTRKAWSRVVTVLRAELDPLAAVVEAAREIEALGQALADLDRAREPKG